MINSSYTNYVTYCNTVGVKPCTVDQYERADQVIGDLRKTGYCIYDDEFFLFDSQMRSPDANDSEKSGRIREAAHTLNDLFGHRTIAVDQTWRLAKEKLC